MSNAIQIGRFAPSPTGVLHLGSLMAATASYLNVKSVGGRWLVRIDDLDTPRVVAGSADAILQTLEGFGFEWDGLIWQSNRLALYQSAFEHLVSQSMVYACHCSRAQVLQRVGKSGVYDNHCRQLGNYISRNSVLSQHQSLRLIAPHHQVIYQDDIQDNYVYDWASIGDPVLRRADHIWSYHLACAVDDADFGITEVIRGYDLLNSTPPQIYIQQQLGYTSPHYAHYPILLSEQNIKFSKASHAPAVDVSVPAETLYQVLVLLGQSPPSTLANESLTIVWDWAVNHWKLVFVPKIASVIY